LQWHSSLNHRIVRLRLTQAYQKQKIGEKKHCRENRNDNHVSTFSSRQENATFLLAGGKVSWDLNTSFQFWWPAPDLDLTWFESERLVGRKINSCS
jgi:hypothetical protein